jgi:hypothetical protein
MRRAAILAAIGLATFGAVALAQTGDVVLQPGESVTVEAAPAPPDTTVTETITATPTGPTSPPPPPTTTTTPPSCVGVQVTAGADFTGPPGTTYCIVGTVQLANTVTLKDGDHVVGGALQGAGARNLLTAASGAHVSVSGTELYGAVGDSTCAPDCGRAIEAAGVSWSIDHITCHDNAGTCLSGGGASVTFTDSLCYGNGFGAAFLDPAKRSSACIKRVRQGGNLTVTGSTITDNAWVGIWCDFCENGPTLIEGNTITGNGKAAISYEVSGGWSGTDSAIIRNNILKDNGDAGDPTRISNVPPTAITCNSCAELAITGNIFGGNVIVLHTVNARRGSWGNIYGLVVSGNTLNGDVLTCPAGASCTANS